MLESFLERMAQPPERLFIFLMMGKVNFASSLKI